MNNSSKNTKAIVVGLLILLLSICIILGSNIDSVDFESIARIITRALSVLLRVL